MRRNDRAYVRALLIQSVGVVADRPGAAAFVIIGVFVNCILWWYAWTFLFDTVGTLHGWTLADLSTFMGITCTGWGAVFFFCAGTPRIAQAIVDGSLDVVLTRPRHPLPQLIVADADPSWLGVSLFGLFVMAAFSHLSVPEWGLALAAAVLVGLLYFSIGVLLQCLAFYMSSGATAADELLAVFDTFASIPQHTQGLAIQVVLLTVIPAGLVAILPVSIVRDHNLGILAGMAVAVAFYFCLALHVFNRGLCRYTSATGWTA